VDKPSSASKPVLEVSNFGAKGDAVTDDTEAIEKAIAAAAGEGAVVRFPRGKFPISRPLRIIPGVDLQGLDKGACQLVASPGFKADPPKVPLPGGRSGWDRDFRKQPVPAMIYLAGNSTLSDLTIRGSEATRWTVLTANAGGVAKDVVVTRCDIVNPFTPLLEPGKPKERGVAFGVSGGAERVEISHCELQALVGIEAVGGPFRRCRTLFNTYHASPSAVGPYGTTQMGWVVGDECVVEGNTCAQANRGFTCGPWFGPVRHNFIARNRVSDSGVIEGGGESFLFEGPEVGKENWVGHPSLAGPDFLEQGDQKWQPHRMTGRIALVVHGNGIGQFRLIADNTAGRATLQQPWRIVPDKDSWVVVRPFFFENVLLNNCCRDTKGGLELTGALHNVVDRFVASRSRNGIWLFGQDVADDAQLMPYGPVAFNEIRDCLLTDCGCSEISAGGLIKFSGVRLWSNRRIDRTRPLPTVFGNSVSKNQFERCGIVAEERVLQAKPTASWLPPSDTRRTRLLPAITFNAFGNNLFDAGPREGSCIELDPWTFGTLCWLQTTPEGSPASFKDLGQQTVKMRR
jgi:hypothetical protein